MSCSKLYGSDALEMMSCVGNASNREPVVMHWPSFEAHFQDDGAYFLHDGDDTVLVDVHHVELRRAGASPMYSRPVVSVDRGTSIRFSPATLGIGTGRDRGAAAASFPTGVVPLAWRTFRRFRALRRALAESSPDGGSGVERRLAAMLADLVRAAPLHRPLGGAAADRGSVRRRRAVEQAKAYLSERLHERPTLGDVAGAVDYAPHHFARIFRASTGLSVHRYLNDVRLRQAAARLDEGAGNLTSLALDLGFSSQGHFTTVFRQRFGCTPGAYRAQSFGAEAR